MKNDTVTDLNLGLLSVCGADAKKFLQGQLTCNLDDIGLQETRLCAHCNPQGRIHSLSRIFYFNEQYYLQMPSVSIPSALSALKKYSVFFKVSLADASDTFFCIGYCGELLESFFDTLPIETDSVRICHSCLIVKLPGMIPRYEIIGKKEDKNNILEKLSVYANTMPENHWHYLNIKTGIPAIYPETTEKFLPHEINLHTLNGISLNKGCYIGQEIIARMQYRGKLKTHLYRAETTSMTAPLKGSEIYTEKGSCGYIVDAVETSDNHHELLLIAQETDVLSTSIFLDADKQIILELEKQ